MTTNLLVHRAVYDTRYDVRRVPERASLTVCEWIELKPISGKPRIIRRNDLGMFAAIYGLTFLEKQVADYGPSGSNIIFIHEAKEAIDRIALLRMMPFNHPPMPLRPLV